MKPEIRQEEQQPFDLPGQMAFFPDMEPDPAPNIVLQRPITPPELSQLEDWHLC